MNFGERIANRQLQKVGRKLRASYRTAQKELEETLADFNKRFKEKDRQKRALKAAGKISEQEYKDWLSGQVFIRGQWEKKLKSVCRVLHEYNVQAGKMIHEGKIDVFAENYNYSAFVAEQKTGISFDIYNTEAVTRLIKDEPQVLPEWKVDEEKDYKWNRKKVQNAVTQGIIQGESIEDITARLCRDLVTTNENKMRLFARTAMTGAQNAGRQKHMEQAAKKGIRQNKRWVATLDSRTRDAHRELDGQEVPYDKPFIIDGEEIMFPGDPSAPPALSYNCRCRHVTIYPDYEDYSKRDWREDEIIDGQSYEEWKNGKKARGEVVSEQKASTKQQESTSGYKADSFDNDYVEREKTVEKLKEKADKIAKENEGRIKELNDNIAEYQAQQRTSRTTEEYETADKKITEAQREKHMLEREGKRALQEYKETKEQMEKQYAIEKAVRRAQEVGIEWLQPQRRNTDFDMASVISRLGGGDKTDGSCFSLAYCYVGQRAGYDVLDFRGGRSQSYFSASATDIVDGMIANGVKGKIGEGTYDSGAGKKALSYVKEGKEYMFVCAGHAAIVRKEKGRMEYLELQNERNNGWKPFSDNLTTTINDRFDGRGRLIQTGNQKAYVVDVEDMMHNERWLKPLGYMNTKEEAQDKGAGGHEK